MNLEDITDEDYYAELKAMFQTTGWKIFCQELAENATHINSVEDTETLDQLFFRKGQLAVLGNVLNTEIMILRAEAEASDEN